MLNLAFIFHMHQPYYKNLLTQESEMPWVRLHGIKDYLDMVQMLEAYPKVRLTFNLVPSLLEQVEDYAQNRLRDKFLDLSYKPANELTWQEKEFIRENFFSINKDKVIVFFPRYYDLYLKRQRKIEYSDQDYLDLQVWFNLVWFDPYFRQNFPELREIEKKARYFTEPEKRIVLDKQREIMAQIIPAYRKFMASGQIEVTPSPYYHPILPLLCNTKIAREANIHTPALPKNNFAHPEDAQSQIDLAKEFYQDRFLASPVGMWPSEESVSEHVIPLFIKSNIKWIVSDEAILFKSLKRNKRDSRLLYQPFNLKRKDGELAIVFRDRNLSDLIGFVYHSWKAEDAVNDLMKHLENIARAFKNQDVLVTIAMDGENAWEYYSNDGHDFLELFYQRLSEADFLRTTTISEYLKTHQPKLEIKRLSAGSWIYADFGKWIGNPYKVKAWEWLAEARKELEKFVQSAVSAAGGGKQSTELAWKQMYILEGSDWFWWYGDNHVGFDQLFRQHLINFYTIIGKAPPDYLRHPLSV